MHEEVVPSAVPDQKMLALVNTYIINTARMMNDFATSCDQTLSQVHHKLQTAETQLAILEARLTSAASGSPEDVENSLEQSANLPGERGQAGAKEATADSLPGIAADDADGSNPVLSEGVSNEAVDAWQQVTSMHDDVGSGLDSLSGGPTSDVEAQHEQER